MTISSTRWTKLLAAQPGSSATLGLIEAYRREALGVGMAHGIEVAGARELLGQLAAVPTVRRGEAYDNPCALQGPVPDPKPLTPADIAWLGTLPSDPKAVSYEDARTLAKLEAETQSGSPDRRLVRSRLDKVRRLHDTAAAKVELDNARRLPTPAVPQAALRVVADAVMAETPGLTPDEATARAASAIREATDQRDQAHARRIADAKAAVDAASGPFTAEGVEQSESYRGLAQIAARTGDRSARLALETNDMLRRHVDAPPYFG